MPRISFVSWALLRKEQKKENKKKTKILRFESKLVSSTKESEKKVFNVGVHTKDI